MKKVLIITYYWPPSGGSGVQRWLKFAKYLPENNWQPVIYTVENGEYPVIDKGLEKDIPHEAIVIKQPIWEPYNFYKRFTGSKKSEKFGHGFVGNKKKKGYKKWLNNLAIYVRGNYFIPDARMFWIKPSVKFLRKYLLDNPVDAIVSTGTPHSVHLIALELKKQTGLCWLADFRDPWTGVYYLQSMKLTQASLNKHKKLEKKVLLAADVITTVGNHLKKNLKLLVTEQDISSKIIVLPNGFDFEVKSPELFSEKFQMVYAGLFSKEQNHPLFWQALSEVCKENAAFRDKFKLVLVGNVDVSIDEEISKNELSEVCVKKGYVSHAEVLRYQQEAAVLLLSINNYPGAKEMLTGKLFEYIASGRPIFCIGPKDGDASGVIQETGTGFVCEWDDKNAMKETLLFLFEAFKEKKQVIHPQKLQSYSRKQLTVKLAQVLNNLAYNQSK